ncbi:MAG: carboxypeptidase regulatory-like domain-containing protein [Anaerolineae bacterium]|nr:carboxypeptidase regulatory-like domain-containing protein [Anaerolineae bacterium]
MAVGRARLGWRALRGALSRHRPGAHRRGGLAAAARRQVAGEGERAATRRTGIRGSRALFPDAPQRLAVSARDDNPGDLFYGAFLGGSSREVGYGIVVDEDGAAYVTGYTYSVDFPTTPRAFDTSYGGGQSSDAFAVKLVIGAEGYSISGRVTDAGGGGLPGVTVSGGWAGTAVTNAHGDYALRHVITGTCTLTPTLVGYTFDPITRTVSVPPDATGQDFQATQLTYSISGRVSDVDDNPMAGVTISVTGGYSVTTDVLGTYTLTNLISGTYTLTPMLEGYVLEPITRTVHVPPNATGQDFRAVPEGYLFYLSLVLRNW